MSGQTQDAPRSRRPRIAVLRLVLVALAVVFVLLGAGLAISGVLSGTDKNKHAITLAQYRSAHPGDSRSAVHSALGGVDPSDGKGFESHGLASSDVKLRCEYYNEKGKDLGKGTYYRFCFHAGKLSSKGKF